MPRVAWREYRRLSTMWAHPRKCSLHSFYDSQKTTLCHRFVYLRVQRDQNQWKIDTPYYFSGFFLFIRQIISDTQIIIKLLTILFLNVSVLNEPSEGCKTSPWSNHNNRGHWLERQAELGFANKDWNAGNVSFCNTTKMWNKTRLKTD